MTKQEREAKLSKIIAVQYGVNVDDLKPEYKFDGDLLRGDSLDTVELCMECEDVFDIEIRDEEMEAADTVQGLFDLIERLVPTTAEAPADES